VTPGPELALAASARDWPDRLHRFLLDHGGGRVSSRVMGTDQAMSDVYEVLVIDDICSFLTPRLVRTLRQSGREIVGVYSPVDAPDAKRLLLECGITDVVESDAAPEEFLSVVTGTLAHKRVAPGPAAGTKTSFRIGVLGAIGGVGVTEVSIGIAEGLSQAVPTLLIDLDQQSPSIAQRLDLPLHPNLLSAVDSAHHGGDIGAAIIETGRLGVIGGLASSGNGEVSLVEIDGLLEDVAGSGYQMLVADLGAPQPERLPGLRLNVLIAVGSANPVGLSRLVRLVQLVGDRAGFEDLVAVANRVGGGRREFEVRTELARLLPEVPVVLLPEDRGLERAAWDGVGLGRGPFARSVARIATLIQGATR
jgi:MinD-like ATPase involved in chromosome partitioning or flagellar assembly